MCHISVSSQSVKKLIWVPVSPNIPFKSPFSDFETRKRFFNKWSKIQSYFYYQDNRRTLIVKNGTKIIVEMTGEGYRFGVWQTIKNLGSYFGILGTVWFLEMLIIPRAFHCVMITKFCKERMPCIVLNLNDEEKRNTVGKELHNDYKLILILRDINKIVILRDPSIKAKEFERELITIVT